MSDLDEYNELKYFDQNNAEFYETENGFLSLVFNGEDLGRVNAVRMFPFTMKDTYISIINNEKKEITVIHDLKTLPDSQKKMIEHDLERRYFVPEITEFIDIKEEFNYTFFKCNTASGYREITAFDMNASLLSLPNGDIILNDIDGNKYLIRDIENKGKKAMKYLQIWL